MIIQDIIRLRIAGEYFIINITSCLLTLDAKVMHGFGACSNARYAAADDRVLSVTYTTAEHCIPERMENTNFYFHINNASSTEHNIIIYDN